MAGFLYFILLRLLYPTSIVLVLLVVTMLCRHRPTLRRWSFGLALTVLLVCGNGWVVHGVVRYLEWQYLPPDPMPTADAILVLSGGIRGAQPPRATVEVNESGDRVLYGAELYRLGRAPKVICTGNVSTGSMRRRSEAEDMADLLVRIGVPRAAIVLETKALNTHDHAVNLCPMFAALEVRRVLLVTSALHMTRSVGVFRRACPDVDYVPAPTDFRAVARLPVPWHRSAANLIPTPQALVDFTDAAHEYLGMAYYRLRGWM